MEGGEGLGQEAGPRAGAGRAPIPVARGGEAAPGGVAVRRRGGRGGADGRGVASGAVAGSVAGAAGEREFRLARRGHRAGGLERIAALAGVPDGGRASGVDPAPGGVRGDGGRSGRDRGGWETGGRGDCVPHAGGGRPGLADGLRLRGRGGGGGGGGGSSGGGGGGPSYQFSGEEWDGELPPAVEEFFLNLEQFFNQIEGWQIVAIVAALFIFFLLIWLITIALSTIGRIGLVQGTVQSEEGTEKLTFGALFREGKPFFWRVLGLNFLIGVALLILIGILLIPFILITMLTFGIGAFCLIPFICLLIPLSWLVKLVIQQANVAIIVEDLSIFDAIQRGWDVFRQNLWNLVLMGLILGIGGAIVGFVIALPLLLIVFVMLAGAGIGLFSEASFAFGGSLLAGGLAILFYIPILIFLGGVLQAYIQSAWTLTYLQLTDTSPASGADLQLEDV